MKQKFELKPWATIKTRGWTRTACTERGLWLLISCADMQGFKMNIVWHREPPAEILREPRA